MKINILVITKSPWNNTNTVGNTLSNLFRGWDGAEFYNIYLREEVPNNDVCNNYYRITEKQLMKHFIQPSKIGQELSSNDFDELRTFSNYIDRQEKEKRMLDFFRNNRATVFLFFREVIWKIGRWNNKKLDAFLENNRFDCIFAFGADPIYLQNIVLYCAIRANARLFLYFVDDIYSNTSYSPLGLLYKCTLRRAIKRTVVQATKIYGISKELCDEYEAIFNRKIELLHKCCDFTNTVVRSIVSHPINIVYAGNLYYGRKDILGALADEIEKINHSDTQIRLDIYTSATITPEINEEFNRGASTRVLGTRTYEEIKGILSKADLVLHVESFDKKQILLTRLSFSTKITDCLQSGNGVMVIGPNNVASIRYLGSIPGAIVINSLDDIGQALDKIVADPRIIITSASRLNDYVKSNCNTNDVRAMLQNDFSAYKMRKEHI